ncbi:MAG: hypothetical protein V2G33_03710 [bacterium JZ-2024 1]
MGKILLVLCIMLAALGQVSLKYGVSSLPAFSTEKAFYWNAVHNPFVLLGGFLYLLSAILWMRVLSLIPLSIAYPSIGGTYVVVVLLSYGIFHEPLTVGKLAGVSFILTGITLLSQSR